MQYILTHTLSYTFWHFVYNLTLDVGQKWNKIFGLLAWLFLNLSKLCWKTLCKFCWQTDLYRHLIVHAGRLVTHSLARQIWTSQWNIYSVMFARSWTLMSTECPRNFASGEGAASRVNWFMSVLNLNGDFRVSWCTRGYCRRQEPIKWAIRFAPCAVTQ